MLRDKINRANLIVHCLLTGRTDEEMHLALLALDRHRDKEARRHKRRAMRYLKNFSRRLDKEVSKKKADLARRLGLGS